MLQHYEASLAGKNLADLLCLLCGEDYGKSRRLQQVLEKEVFDEDILLIRHDREIFKLSFYAYWQPGTNKISSIIAVIRESHKNIGFRSRKDEELPGSRDESMFRAYLDNTLAPAWIADEDGRTLFMNRLALNIWHLDESYRFKHAYELFPKQIADEFLASDKAVLETGQPIAFVIPSIRKDVGATTLRRTAAHDLPDYSGAN